MNGSDGAAPRSGLPLTTTVPLAIVFAVGVVLSCLWLVVLVPTLMFVSRAHAADGVFLGSEARVGGLHAGTFMHPTIRFVTPDGKVVDVVAKSGSSNQPYDDGQKMRVLYDPGRPQDARSDDFFEIWAGPVFMTPFALLPLLIPVYIYAQVRRRR